MLPHLQLSWGSKINRKLARSRASLGGNKHRHHFSNLDLFVYVLQNVQKLQLCLVPKLKPTPLSYPDIVKFTACWGGGAVPLHVPCFFGHLMSVIMNSFNRKCAIWFLHYGLIILCDHETDCNNADTTILTPCQLIRAHYCSLYSGSNIQHSMVRIP